MLVDTVPLLVLVLWALTGFLRGDGGEECEEAVFSDMRVV